MAQFNIKIVPVVSSSAVNYFQVEGILHCSSFLITKVRYSVSRWRAPAVRGSGDTLDIFTAVTVMTAVVHLVQYCEQTAV